ncbi:MAG: thermonuclease family protein [Nitrososphaerota archaeon]
MRKPVEFTGHPIQYSEARDKGFTRGWCRYVVDGDTLDCLIDLGFGNYAYTTLRLNDIDTPEIYRPKDPQEREIGNRARDYTAAKVLDKPVLLKSHRDTETFGRYVAEVYYLEGQEWFNLGYQLQALGLAKKKGG